MAELWDAVGFDEVADLEKMPKEVITTMKTYCESGKFQRGAEESAGFLCSRIRRGSRLNSSAFRPSIFGFRISAIGFAHPVQRHAGRWR
jgi:hypothetical protein